MTRLFLDTNVLGFVVHPNKFHDVKLRFLDWIADVDVEVLVSEVCDYELRRKLLHIDSFRGVAHLDKLGESLGGLVPVTTPIWRATASLWAEQRKCGRPGADEKALDADLLLAAQALERDATVVTTNLRHFEGIVSAMLWDH